MPLKPAVRDVSEKLNVSSTLQAQLSLSYDARPSLSLLIHGAIVGSLVQMEPVRDAPTTAAMPVPSHPDRSSLRSSPDHVLPGREVQMPMRALQGAGRGELRSHGTCGPNVRSRASNTPRATLLLTRDDCESNAASALAADRFTRARLRACGVWHDTGHRLLAVHHRKPMPPGVLSSLASLRASP